MPHLRELSEETNKSIELCLDGTFSPKEFADTIKAFTGLLNEVSEEVSPNTGVSDWRMSVKEGSMRITASPDLSKENSVETALQVIPLISAGLTQLDSDPMEDRHDVKPFSDTVLKYVKDIAKFSTGEQGKRVSIGSNGSFILLSERISENAHQLLEPKKPHTATGAVEGELSTLTDRQGFRMVVYRSLDGLAVNCIPSNPTLEVEVIKAFRKRVLVYGTVKYNSKGLPTRVTAERIRVFKPDEELTPLSEIRGILR